MGAGFPSGGSGARMNDMDVYEPVRHFVMIKGGGKRAAARRACTLTIFCGDLFHYLDLEVALDHQLLQSGIFRLELLQAAHLVGRQGAKPFAPIVNRLLADLVALGHHAGRLAIVRRELAAPQQFLPRLTPKDRHHLLVGEPRLAHLNPLPRRSVLKQLLVRNSWGTSGPRRKVSGTATVQLNGMN